VSVDGCVLVCVAFERRHFVLVFVLNIVFNCDSIRFESKWRVEKLHAFAIYIRFKYLVVSIS